MNIETIDLQDENINFKVEVRPQHINHQGDRIPAKITISSASLTTSEAIRAIEALTEAVRLATSKNAKGV